MEQKFIVKLVLSGDTIVVWEKGSNNLPGERLISLAHVSAPKFGRVNEPFGFAAREELRRLCVGKQVAVKTVQTGNREFASVQLDGVGDLALAMVEKGLVNTRNQTDKNIQMDEILVAAERIAKQNTTGIWGNKVPIPTELDAKPKELVEKYNGVAIDAVIEGVRSGDVLRTRLILNSGEHVLGYIIVAGIKCPSTSRVSKEGQEVQGEPFGDEAKMFVEQRVLQRNVKIVPVGANQSGQMMVGVVSHPKGNIAHFLLAAGLARCVDWQSPMLGADMEPLRLAESSAKSKKLYIWKDFEQKQKIGGVFDATVARIVNSDTLELRLKNGNTMVVQLSSIRQPRAADEVQKTWQDEAREIARKKLIGKHVQVSIDYKKPAQEGYEAKDVATIVYNGKNVALALIEQGLVTVIKHRKDDEDRSPDYDLYLSAEKNAQSSAVGIWSGKPPKSYGVRVVNASENAARAKQFLSTFQRSKRVSGLVEYVVSGSRFRMFVPRESARCILVLSGVKTPRAGGKQSEAEPFGDEALDLANKRVLQREVEFEVENVDKVGGFIGTLYTPNKDNLARVLLSEGLASVHEYSAEISGHSAEYNESENGARMARRGLWLNYIEEAIQNGDSHKVTTEEKTGPVPLARKYVDLIVTEPLQTTGVFSVQVIGQELGKLESLMTQFRALHVSAPSLATLPRNGELVAAKFSADGQFYRARVNRVEKERKMVEVVYIDYGNSETIPIKDIHALGGSQFSTGGLAAQSLEATLSFVKLPSEFDENNVQAAKELFQDLTVGKKLVGNIDYKSGTSISVTLYNAEKSEDSEMSINSEMVQLGLATVVPKKKRTWENGAVKTLAHLDAKQNDARRNRRGVFEYGDVQNDDD